MAPSLMFEEDVDGQPLPCEHPIRWFHRLAAWVHDRTDNYESMATPKRHDALPDWVCEAWERVYCSFPCRQCADDRYREYGATTPDDDAVIRKFPSFQDLLSPTAEQMESYTCCYREIGTPHADYCNTEFRLEPEDLA